MSTTNETLTPAVPARMLLDDLVPVFDATRIEHRVLDATPPDTYRAVVEADFIGAWRDSVVMRALFAARGTAEDLVSRARGQEHRQPPAPASMRLEDMGTHGEYVRLGDDPPREIAFGMIGRFWSGETAWRTIDAAKFASFDEPGLARIGCNFSLRPYGERRTLLSYEARTQATDDASRRQFLRYWKLVSPGVGMVMRGMLAVIEPQPAG